MYAHKARNSLIRIFKEAPELADLATRGEPPIPWGKIRDNRTRKLTDRMISELWMMGFAISARQPSDHAPVKGGRNPEVHKAWRNEKLPPPKKTNQTDVEAQASKPSAPPSGPPSPSPAPEQPS